jgi:hypothetical protein
MILKAQLKQRCTMEGHPAGEPEIYPTDLNQLHQCLLVLISG